MCVAVQQAEEAVGATRALAAAADTRAKRSCTAQRPCCGYEKRRAAAGLTRMEVCIGLQTVMRSKPLRQGAWVANSSGDPGGPSIIVGCDEGKGRGACSSQGRWGRWRSQWA